jgi:hypothetical protein
VNESEISIYPSPPSREFSIRKISSLEEKIRLKITNSTGELICERTENVNAGDNILHVDYSRFAPGIYFIELEGRNGRVAKKILIEK